MKLTDLPMRQQRNGLLHPVKEMCLIYPTRDLQLAQLRASDIVEVGFVDPCYSTSNDQLPYGYDNLWVQDALRTRTRKWIHFLKQDQLGQLDFDGFTLPFALVPTIYDMSADLPSTIAKCQRKITQLIAVDSSCRWP